MLWSFLVESAIEVHGATTRQSCQLLNAFLTSALVEPRQITNKGPDRYGIMVMLLNKRILELTHLTNRFCKTFLKAISMLSKTIFNHD